MRHICISVGVKEIGKRKSFVLSLGKSRVLDTQINLENENCLLEGQQILMFPLYSIK